MAGSSEERDTYIIPMLTGTVEPRAPDSPESALPRHDVTWCSCESRGPGTFRQLPPGRPAQPSTRRISHSPSQSTLRLNGQPLEYEDGRAGCL